MSSIVNWMERVIVPIAGKLGSQKHLTAIRDAFAGTMPLMLPGAFAVMFNNVFFTKWSLLANYTFNVNGSLAGFFNFCEKWIVPVMGAVWEGSLALMSLIFVIGLAYHRANQEKQDAPSTILIVMGSLVVMGMAKGFFDASGIIVTMIMGLIFCEINFFVVRKKWTIKMPASVPPAVSKSFSAVIPGMICLVIAAFITLLFNQTTVNDAPATMYSWFSANVQGFFNMLGASPVTIVLMAFFTTFLWFFGIHGHQMLTPLYEGIYQPFQLYNVDWYKQHGVIKLAEDLTATKPDGLYPWVRSSWDLYCQMGGSGSTLCLLIAIFLVGKVKSEKEIAKLATPMGIFQINEPVTFGVPIILNVVYAIPFIFIPVIQTIIAYTASATGFAGPVVNIVGWTTPPVISAFIATNGSLGATLIAAINFALGIVLYIPFVLVSNKINGGKEA